MAELVRSAASDRADTRLSGKTIPSALISFYATFFALVAFIASSDKFLHWFIIPVALCGVLIGIDAVDWLRGRLRLLSPIGIVGVLGFHFFFLAPLLHVLWDYWMRYVVPPDDWRPWLGGMAALNLAGIIVYRVGRSLTLSRRTRAQRPRRVWQIDARLFPAVMLAALLLTTALQVAVYSQYGGIAGYIEAYESRYEADSFVGMGYIFSISESFPILAMMLYAFYANRRNFGKSWASIVIVLLLFFIVAILFGGLRGSRSNTIWELFWAVGIIHFWIRPIPKKVIALGVVFLVGFMYLYGFYKAGGLEALAQLGDPQQRAALERQSGRTVEAVLLGDLGRSDMQAFLLYRLTRPDSDYQYAMGRTYLAGAVTFIPRVIWPERPVTKVKEGTEAQYGMGSYIPGRLVSSRVYGLAGEAMLNFGVLAAPFAFAVLGLVVRWMERLTSTLKASDARWLLVPLLVNMSFVVLQADSDNIVWGLVKNGIAPFLVVFIGSKILIPSPDHPAACDEPPRLP